MKQALVVIDVQRGLLNDPPGAFETDLVVGRINDLSSRARKAAVPIVLIQHERPGTPVQRGSEGWLFHDDLVVQESDVVVHKTTPDSFLRTDLARVLEEYGVEELVVCGYASEFCIDTTVRRAAALGFPVTLVSDAHTTHDKEHAQATWIRAHHNATLSDITSFGPAIRAIPAAEVEFGGDSR